jgi:hypothetical protein
MVPSFNLQACGCTSFEGRETLHCHVNANGAHINPKTCECERAGCDCCPIDRHNPRLALALESQGFEVFPAPANETAEQRARRMASIERSLHAVAETRMEVEQSGLLF